MGPPLRAGGGARRIVVLLLLAIIDARAARAESAARLAVISDEEARPAPLVGALRRAVESEGLGAAVSAGDVEKALDDAAELGLDCRGADRACWVKLCLSAEWDGVVVAAVDGGELRLTLVRAAESGAPLEASVPLDDGEAVDAAALRAVRALLAPRVSPAPLDDDEAAAPAHVEARASDEQPAPPQSAAHPAEDGEGRSLAPAVVALSAGAAAGLFAASALVVEGVLWFRPEGYVRAHFEPLHWSEVALLVGAGGSTLVALGAGALFAAGVELDDGGPR